jgi:hypothetical protein
VAAIGSQPVPERTAQRKGEAMRKTLGFLVIALFAFVPTLWAAETAFDQVNCFVSKTIPLESTPDITAFAVDTVGIAASSTTKEWESATWHCVLSIRIMAGKWAGGGLCKMLDSAGDSYVNESTYTGPGEGTATFLSGTGKYKGIHGGGIFKAVVNGKPIVEGTSATCNHYWGKYTLP